VRRVVTSEHEVLTDADLDPTDGTSVRTERWTDRGGTLAVLRSILGGGDTWPSSRRQFSGGENFGVTSAEVDASAEAVAFVLDPRAWSPPADNRRGTSRPRPARAGVVAVTG
jgi:poly(3-hydroxybutyrate) depolymerase